MRQRRVEGRIFEIDRFVTRAVLGRTAYINVVPETRRSMRAEIFHTLQEHFGKDFGRAMTHITHWGELELPWNLYPELGDSPLYKPDLRLRVSVRVEDFDVTE